jgi:mannose/fructose/N-acetylgalactosamine-specific phosphotransferase system component IID
MVYNATYEAGDLVNIVFDILGGVGAELATNKSALGGLILLVVVIALFTWVMKGGKKIMA